MATHADPANLDAFLPAAVVLLQNIVDSMVVTGDAVPASIGDALASSRAMQVHHALIDMNTIVAFVLHDFRLAHARIVLDDELGFWVLPRSTAWFSQFLLHEYSDDRWVANFRFTKATIFRMSSLLAPHVEQQDTTY
jgi:hypothetical protein